MQRLIAAIALALLALPATAAPALTTVRVETGQLQGAVTDGVLAFKGVPFAAPPTGPLRWRPPQPAAKWAGVRPATAHGADCLQGPIPGDPGIGTRLSEDCLYLNVWRPADAGAKKLPVLVWIYGGGLVNGGTQPAIYQGDQFARQGLVFVSINYRLGRFGFFGHPALTAEDPSELKGNYGYMDQLAALKWVQRNIAAFGGDPANVTVFGESAGGYSVHTLVATPLAKGLFQRAMVESGGGRDQLGAAPALSRDAPGLPSGETIGLAFATSQGIEGSDAAALAKLRALPADKITGGLSMRTFMSLNPVTYSGPVIDGKLVVEPIGVAYAKGHNLKVPILVGANSADLGRNSAQTLDALLAPFSDKAALLAAYDPEGTKNLPAIRQKLGMDQAMIEPARYVAQAFAKQGLAAYHYRFDYVGAALKARAPNGAPHATEIPYVFGTYGPGYIAMVSPTKSGDAMPADLAMSRAVQGYWVNFAKTGNPNGPGLPRWPRYDPAQDQVMVFRGDGVVGAVAEPLKARLDVVAASRK